MADEAILGRSVDWRLCFLSCRTIWDVHLIKAQWAFTRRVLRACFWGCWASTAAESNMLQNRRNQDPKLLGQHPNRPARGGMVRHGEVTALVEKGETAHANSDDREMDTCNRFSLMAGVGEGINHVPSFLPTLSLI